MMELTSREHEYILELSEGPKTIRELARTAGISDANVSKRVAGLRAMGIVRSTWATRGGCRVYVHELARSYGDLVSRGFTVRNYDRKRITPEEIYYAAILTNGGMTGLRKAEQYRRVYPDRTASALKNIITRAKRMHLCR